MNQKELNELKEMNCNHQGLQSQTRGLLEIAPRGKPETLA